MVLAPYNIVADGEDVDCLVIDSQSYKDLSNALELSRLAQKKEELEEEAAYQRYRNHHPVK